MKIGILGTGTVGVTLGTKLVQGQQLVKEGSRAAARGPHRRRCCQVQRVRSLITDTPDSPERRDR